MEYHLLSTKVFQYYKYSAVFFGNNVKSNELVELYETKESKIWVINPNKINIDFSLLEKIDNIKYHPYDINGIWAAIIQDKENNSFRLLTSINNEQPWYYITSPKPAVSNNIFLLTDFLEDIEPNYRAISSFLSFDFCYGGETFLSNINKSYGGDIIYINNNKIKIVSADLNNWLGFDESIYDRNVILDAFILATDKILKNQPAQILLTGGSDSRAILAAALYTKNNFTFMTGTAPSADKKDITLARKISKRLKVKHDEVDESKLKIDNFDAAIEKIAILTNTEFIPRNWIMFYKEYAMHENKLDGLNRLMGYRGEVFKGFPLNALKSFDNKSTFINERNKKKLKELLYHRFETYKRISPINANELFYQRERDHFWVSGNIKSYQNYCHIYTPFSDNYLLSLGYRFTGGIRNSKLHENVLGLLPENIRNLPFQSSLLNRVIRHYKRKIFTEVNYSFMLKPDYIFQNLNMEIINEVITKDMLDIIILKYKKNGFYDDIAHKLFAISYFFKLIY